MIRVPMLTGLVGLLLAAPYAKAEETPATVPAGRSGILAVMEKMADAQLAQPKLRERMAADWVSSAFYVGLARLSHVSTKSHYLEAERAIAANNHWEFKPATARNVAMADNEVIGQMYIDLAVTDHDPGKLDAARAQWDQVLASFDDPAHVKDWNGDLSRDGKAMPWWWCDSLYMAPPGLVRLSAVTGDRKYLDTADHEWWITCDRLYDKEEHLFYRDSKYLTQKTPNGKKVFWSRGNGWVVAGTANVLMYMPADYPSRGRYERLLQEMCTRLASLQQADGLWRMSLLDPEANLNAETSGTGFFCYAMAWGVNNKLLERAKFEPVIHKAWAAMNRHILPSGLIGAVQPVGQAPASASFDNTSEPYAVAGFLLSGCEIIKMHGDR